MGSILRIYHLGTEDLWLDEIFTIGDARQSVFKLLPHVLENGAFPFLAVLIHFTMRLFGESAITVRLPSCIFGILGIPMIFLVGRKMFNDIVGLCTACFLAISPYHIYYSQEARAYTLQIFLLLAVIFFFLKVIEDNSPINWLLFLGCELLATFAHWYSTIMILSINLYFVFLWISKKEIRLRTLSWIISQSIYLIVTIPWLLTLSSYHVWEKAKWIPPLSPKVIPETFYDFSTSITEMNFPAWILWFGSLIFCILFFLAFVRRFSGNKNDLGDKSNFSFSLSLALFIFPIVIFYLYSLRLNSYLAWRYLIIALPGFYLLSAQGLTWITSRWVKTLFLILICFVYGFCLYIQFLKPHKISLRKPAEYVRIHYKLGDAIMIIPPFWGKSFSYYNPDAINVLLPDPPTYYETASAESAKKYERIWLVEVPEYIEPFPLTHYYQNHQLLLNVLERGVRLSLYSNPIHN